MREKEMKRNLNVAVLLLGLCMMLSACRNQAETAGGESLPGDQKEICLLEEDRKTIRIPGIKDSYRILVINDLHIVETETNREIPKETKDAIQARYDSFVDSNGTASREQWEHLSDQIQDDAPDAVVLAGDLVDFYSPENLETLKNSLDKIEAPVIYTRADHDYGTWYMEEDRKTVKKQEAAICDNSRVILQEFPDFLIVGINNSTSQMTKAGLRALKKIWAKGKPVILITHVPLDSLTDRGLSEESKKLWGDRALLWGKGCYYEPNETTQNYLDMVLGEDSPVVAVVSGHLHFPYTIQLNDRITEYVFDASYKGKMGILTVSGD